MNAITMKFYLLAVHLLHGRDVVWPEDGIGVGMAQLRERAPDIYVLIEGGLVMLEELGK